MASRLTTFIVVLIVTGTLVAGLIVGAQREDVNGPVDLIITNGQVFTGAGGALAQAVAVRGNKILKVGTNRDVKRLRRRQTVSIDAHGATVLAGFNDSHAHLILGGLGLKQLDLLNARTLDAIKDTVREYATANADRPWVLGRGWYYEPFGTSLPTRVLLDSLVPDRPAFLTAYDGHTAMGELTRARGGRHYPTDEGSEARPDRERCPHGRTHWCAGGIGDGADGRRGATTDTRGPAAGAARRGVAGAQPGCDQRSGPRLEP